MITIECFKGLPTEYESFLIDRYSSFPITCRYIEIYRPDYSIYYMLVHDDDRLIDVFIVGNKKYTAVCFNVLADIQPHIVSECINVIFKEFPQIIRVKMDASLHLYNLKKSFMVKKSEDYVLNLPASMNDFYQMLGSSTRKNLKSRKNKLLNYFSSIHYVTKYNAEIEESIIEKIVQLNSSRMKCKGTIPDLDSVKTSKIYQYSQHYGCVSYLELDGNIVAGCIATILNKDIYLHVYAHDNNFSKFNIGESCVEHLIDISIENKLTTFHFLWGQNELKTRLQAKPRLLFTCFVYKSYSFNYVASRLNVVGLLVFNQLKQSRLLRPLKMAVKYFRKRT